MKQPADPEGDLLQRDEQGEVQGIDDGFVLKLRPWLDDNRKPFTYAFRQRIHKLVVQDEKLNRQVKKNPMDKFPPATSMQVYVPAAIKKSDAYAAQAALPVKIVLGLFTGGVLGYCAYKKYQKKQAEKKEVQSGKAYQLTDENLIDEHYILDETTNGNDYEMFN